MLVRYFKIDLIISWRCSLEHSASYQIDVYFFDKKNIWVVVNVSFTFHRVVPTVRPSQYGFLSERVSRMILLTLSACQIYRHPALRFELSRPAGGLYIIWYLPELHAASNCKYAWKHLTMLFLIKVELSAFQTPFPRPLALVTAPLHFDL